MVFPGHRYRLTLPAVFLLAASAWAVCAAGPAAAAEARSLQQIRASAEIMPAADLVGLCTSAAFEKGEFCDGYLRGVVFFWQVRLACTLHTHSERSFCAGATDAEAKGMQALEALVASQAPRSGLTPEERAREDERRAAAFAGAPGQVREKLGSCVPGRQHDAAFCRGYNGRAEGFVATLIAMNPRNNGADPQTLGLGDATRVVGVFLMASADAHRLLPCLSPGVTPAQARDALLAFIGAHPGQQLGLKAIELVSRALYYNLCPATPGVQPNMEPCLEWTSRDGVLGASNNCGEEVTIRFMAGGEAPVVEAAVKPGGFFHSGLSAAQARRAGWLYTACPAGSLASVWFNAADPETRARIREEIRVGAYDCEVEQPSR